MLLKPHFLSRSGYRLPTEAEWEYACRSGSGTSWYHGESVELLPQFAWFKENSNNRTWPVGTLSPNDWGLFDVEGNVHEICHFHLTYPKSFDDSKLRGNEVPDDSYRSQRPSQHLSTRGGSYAYERSITRSGRRWDDGTILYENAHAHLGFRVVRTLNPPELQQARTHRQEANRLQQNRESAAATGERAQAQVAYESLLIRYPENPDYPWELAEFLLEPIEPHWQILVPVEATSRDGTTLTVQSDGSVLASGKSPDNDVYNVRFETRLSAITAIRLEAMTDRSLPGNGPGRSLGNQGGNYHLSKIQLSSASMSSVNQGTSIRIKRAVADFSQNALPVADAIDDKSKTAWGIASETGQPHWAIFEPSKPFGDARGLTLHLQLEFQEPAWKKTTLGRFRISATTQGEPAKFDEWQARLARSSLNGWARLAVTYLLLERPDDAVAALSKAGKDPNGEFVNDLFLLALMNWKLAHPNEARAWLERGLARYDKKTEDTALKQLAIDSFVVAIEQEPVDFPLLTRIWNLVGTPGKALRGIGDAPHEVLMMRGCELAELGQTEKAAAEFARVLDVLPYEVDWESNRAKTVFEVTQWNDVFLRLTELRPEANDLWIARGRRHVLNSRWQDALTDYARTIKSLPIDDEWIDYAALLLLTGDETGYRESIELMLERAGKSPEAMSAYFLSRTNSLSPKAVIEPEKSVELAKISLSQGSNGSKLHVLGLAQLRAHNYEQAVSDFRVSRGKGLTDLEYCQMLLGMAITEVQRGDESAARDWLSQASSKTATKDTESDPTDWLEVQVLLREAESLLPNNSKPAPK